MENIVFVLICVLLVLSLLMVCCVPIVNKMAKSHYMLIIDNDIKYFEFYQQVKDYIRVRTFTQVLNYQVFIRDNENYIFLTSDIEC